MRTRSKYEALFREDFAMITVVFGQVWDHDLGSNWPSCVLMSVGSTVYSQARFSYFQVLSVLSGALPRFDLHLGAKENLSRVRLYAAGAPCDALFPQSPIVLHAGHCF